MVISLQIASHSTINKSKAHCVIFPCECSSGQSFGVQWAPGVVFNDNLLDKEVSSILKRLNSGHIVVGHCSNEEVVQLYDNKIFGVDSSMKLGEYGEILFIKKKKYYRRTLGGKKKRF